MSDPIVLRPRAPLAGTLDLTGVVPDRLAALSNAEIGALIVRYGGEPVRLGEVLSIQGERSPRVHFIGDFSRATALGAGMKDGEVVADGDVGADAGRVMRGGRLEIRGRAGDGAGVAMVGGTLEIRGDAGERLGAAPAGEKRGMTGGEIVVRGSAGAEAGAAMRRGLIVVMGDAGARAGMGTLAGTIVVGGRTGPEPGVFARRGSIIALGAIEPPTTYRFACVFEAVYVRVLLRRLVARYSLNVDSSRIEGLWRRYSGDLGELGKGEILAWTART